MVQKDSGKDENTPEEEQVETEDSSSILDTLKASQVAWSSSCFERMMAITMHTANALMVTKSKKVIP